MKILVLDNYDSFTYNLVHILRHLGYSDVMDIYRNDQLSVEQAGSYDKILFSPGPGVPDEAGIMKEVIRTYAGSKSMLGVCLGHQAIAEVFGAALYNMDDVRHGLTTQLTVKDRDERLFRGLADSFQVCLYHSWAVVKDTVNNSLVVTAEDSDGIIMGIRHREYDIHGVQFHPESILTEGGIEMLKNWIES